MTTAPVQLVPVDSRPAAQLPQRPHPILDLAVLLLIAMWEPLVAGAEVLSTSNGHPWQEWTLHLIAAGHSATAVAIFLRLVHLVVARIRARGNGPSRLARVAQPWLAAFIGLPAVADGFVGGPWAQATGLAYTTAFAWLAVETLRRHNLSLAQIHRGPSAAHRPGALAATSEAVSITGLAIFACYLGSILVGILRQVASKGWATPASATSDHALGIDTAWTLTSAVLSSMVIEDLVVVGAAVLLLTAAKAPAWLIVFVPCAMTVAGHAYYGVAGIGMAAYALMRVMLYRQGGNLIAIAIGHGIFDILVGHVPDRVFAWAPVLLSIPLIFQRRSDDST